MVIHCRNCDQEIYFDSEKVGKNGRVIPLDPITNEPHDCPARKVTREGESGNGNANEAMINNLLLRFEELKKSMEQVHLDVSRMEKLLVDEEGRVPLERLRELERRVSALELKE